MLAIVGCPNVGKSVLFNRLTGAYVTVSNYPGTTVEVSRGKMRLAGAEIEVVDTPGMYSLLPISEEEAVARRLLLDETPRQVLHVVDAKNLQRMLPMTLQLLEAGLPVVLALNMMDESEAARASPSTSRRWRSSWASRCRTPWARRNRGVPANSCTCWANACAATSSPVPPTAGRTPL